MPLRASAGREAGQPAGPPRRQDRRRSREKRSRRRFAGSEEGLSRFRKAEAVREAPSGEALLLVHLDRGGAYRLNATARLMWDLACAGRTADEIADSLGGRLAAPLERLRADAAALVEDLASQSLLEPAGDHR